MLTNYKKSSMSNLLSDLLNNTENDYLDFKEKWYSKDETYKFIHDVICLSNAVCDSEKRYLVIGVDDDKETYEKTLCNANENVKTTEEITQMLQNVMSKIPNIIVFKEVIEDKEIYIIQITPSYIDLPYVLNKPVDYEIKDKKGQIKKKRLIKNSIYSRINSRNTPKDESCDIEIVKKLIAIQKGENLDINEKFEKYLDDTENWKKSGNTYYYSKNPKFKIIRKEPNNMSNMTNGHSFNEVENYHQLLIDTCICKEYWDYKFLNYNDSYCWFCAELYADNTLIKQSSILLFYAKYFFIDKGFNNDTFFIPLREDLVMNYYKRIRCKEDILKTFDWKLCKIFYKCMLPKDISYSAKDASVILDFINYEFLQKGSKYIEENKDWIDSKKKEL